MSEREAFEAWASDNNEWPQCIERSGDSYKLMQTKLKWEAWQAARAQPAQAVPVLTDAEIGDLLDAARVPELPHGYEDVDLRIARAVEAAVRAKMGVAVPMRERELECVIADLTAECKQLRGLLKNLIDIEGPQPGTATWAEEVREAIGIVGKEGA